MRRHLAIVGNSRPTGDLVARVIRGGEPEPPPLRKAPAWPPLPEGLTFRRKLHTVALELALRLRLLRVSVWRALVWAQGVIAVARLYATVIHHTPACHAEFLAMLGEGYRGPRPDCACEREALGLVCTRLITDAGVGFLVDDWDNNGQDLTTMNFHGCGTGTNAEAQGDTALQTESTTVLNPDSTRATGTRSQPAANQYRSVGTLTFDGSASITEHGLLSQSGTGGGVLWDRSVFTAIAVAALDSIQFTYTATVSAGG